MTSNSTAQRQRCTNKRHERTGAAHANEHRSYSDKEFHDDSVPLTQRRGATTMSLLWITMVTGFPCVLMGFAWHKAGMSLTDMLVGTTVGSLLVLLYAFPACLLGSHSGWTFGSLSKPVFGKWGARLVTANICWIFIGWYGVISLFLADALAGLLHPPISTPCLAFICALLMAANNLFGFKGVANFARYFAAPIIIVWVGYTFAKAITHSNPAALLAAPGHVSMWTAITMISSFVMGYACWGNEPDYWRFGQKKAWHALVPLSISLLIGQVIFPVTGWLVAHSSGITDSAAATAFLNQYSFGGLTWVVVTVMIATYFAPQDSNLYGMTASICSLKKVPQRKLVVALALIGGSLAYWLASAGTAKSLEAMCELNAIVLPTATVVMLMEWLLQSCVWRSSAFFEQRQTDLAEIKWPAVIALALGIFVGVITCGIVPGCQCLHGGIPPLTAWLVCATTYCSIRLLQVRHWEAKAGRGLLKAQHNL